MPLIIALVLIVFVGVKVVGDKAQAKQYEEKSANLRSSHDEWVAHHVDKELEAELKRFISSENNYDAVCNEVLQVLRNLEHWKTKTHLNLHSVSKTSRIMSGKARMEFVTRDRELALDIMLARRGKVSNLSTSYGYQAYLSTDYVILKYQQYELVEWMKNTLNQQGCDVDLVYSGVGDSRIPEDCYYWVGTFNSLPLVGETSPQRFKPFSKDLISKR